MYKLHKMARKREIATKGQRDESSAFTFAFGLSHIGTLQLPLMQHCPYARQFKDSQISVLRLPNALRDSVRHDGDSLMIDGVLPGTENVSDFGCLRSLCNSRIHKLEFY